MFVLSGLTEKNIALELEHVPCQLDNRLKSISYSLGGRVMQNDPHYHGAPIWCGAPVLCKMGLIGSGCVLLATKSHLKGRFVGYLRQSQRKKGISWVPA